MPDEKASLLDHLKSWPLALLPHKLLSRLARALTRCRIVLIKNLLIKAFIRRFSVDLSDAETAGPEGFDNFNSFFTRALRDNARPLPGTTDSIISPVDGYISQLGHIDQDSLLQAKGHRFSLTRLLGGSTAHAALFHDGSFATLYLSPRDYHRIHMPVSGRLLETVYVPGRLFSVAPHTIRTIPGVFARNERLVSLFETGTGPMAVIMVGAIFVSCMETVWEGVVNPHLRQLLQGRHFDLPGSAPILLERGKEMGRFNMGSTVILLFGPGQALWSDVLEPGQQVRMGQTLGHIRPAG
jgi:phosphatidylserine decarboxylase